MAKSPTTVRSLTIKQKIENGTVIDTVPFSYVYYLLDYQ